DRIEHIECGRVVGRGRVVRGGADVVTGRQRSRPALVFVGRALLFDDRGDLCAGIGDASVEVGDVEQLHLGAGLRRLSSGVISGGIVRASGGRGVVRASGGGGVISGVRGGSGGRGGLAGTEAGSGDGRRETGQRQHRHRRSCGQHL